MSLSLVGRSIEKLFSTINQNWEKEWNWPRRWKLKIQSRPVSKFRASKMTKLFTFDWWINVFLPTYRLICKWQLGSSRNCKEKIVWTKLLISCCHTEESFLMQQEKCLWNSTLKSWGGFGRGHRPRGQRARLLRSERESCLSLLILPRKIARKERK